MASQKPFANMYVLYEHEFQYEYVYVYMYTIHILYDKIGGFCQLAFPCCDMDHGMNGLYKRLQR